ncbi:hypothetical protein A3K29_05315 [Candidatus Collierbacteria bacterium RIFOXYB2_FULL_46_14]|uniref:Uncharacterized protein n=1 Tax=Candidatus Collierbacteria bacterium GW2011_GWA2_46_26 TaxID=1618381 RepID=A0A0G1PL36_9BACT|nr:MAG: hypothetical protein UX47_C0004G0052 [Candidatus Collierbacteria bacterium GW2011_GWA2_46_26]OGD73512.1 MAG: hypothetical protein A3K29_05315 [Candidatus Collierbacteria bacterium RIFOXYB2_FULL_46_14]OGD76554.1 MAG: hypothetical protein A3K43_05315 [Candidatus Collierbacteria bacterium RIFOXYA2_FULL_46_20]OGD77890.1 MAG: hypothetical protein A3K39_05315 [Candidatus Collierbacteria bacterium RIFOXYC2_FULL_43_15]OGD81180.1 MAG: hypothetical protein A2320_05810 [Pseudomonadales bacterium G
MDKPVINWLLVRLHHAIIITRLVGGVWIATLLLFAPYALVVAAAWLIAYLYFTAQFLAASISLLAFAICFLAYARHK